MSFIYHLMGRSLELGVQNTPEPEPNYLCVRSNKAILSATQDTSSDARAIQSMMREMIGCIHTMETSLEKLEAKVDRLLDPSIQGITWGIRSMDIVESGSETPAPRANQSSMSSEYVLPQSFVIC